VAVEIAVKKTVKKTVKKYVVKLSDEERERLNGFSEARRLVERFEWHYAPRHGSWLDMAESVSACCRLSVSIGVSPTSRS